MAAELFLLPFRPALDANAIIVPGAKLYFYATGTTMLQAVYADEALTTPLSNPVEADAAGAWPAIYLDQSKIYRVVLKDEDGATLPNGNTDPYVPGVVDALAPEIAENAAISQMALAAITTAVPSVFFDNTTDGLAGTLDEQWFATWEDARQRIYLNDAGTAVFKTENATAALIDLTYSKKADLASNDTGKGASLIGADTGGTVEDAIWHKGRTTAIAGSKMAIRWLRDSAAYPLEDIAGIWADDVVTDHGISATFGASDGGAGSPCCALFVMSNNNGSPGDTVAGQFVSNAYADNTTAFGANILAVGHGYSGCKFVGLEIDVQPAAGDTSISSGSIGLAINVFNKAVPGPAMQVGTVGGGTFNNGIILGGLSTAASGLALQSAGTAASLINAIPGTFSDVAIITGNGQSKGIKLTGTGSVHGYIYNDGSNNVRHVLGAGAWILRDNANTTSLVSMSSGGDLNLEAGGVLKVSGTQVVRARDTGWTAMTGTANKNTAYDTGTVSLAQLASRVKYLQDVLAAHGLIGA